MLQKGWQVDIKGYGQVIETQSQQCKRKKRNRHDNVHIRGLTQVDETADENAGVPF